MYTQKRRERKKEERRKKGRKNSFWMCMCCLLSDVMGNVEVCDVVGMVLSGVM